MNVHHVTTSTTKPNSHILTAASPGFIQQYFARSRLHHLSTWKASWSDYVTHYQHQLHPTHYKTSLASKDHKDYYRVIMHIDMDCFFASVGLRDRPSLRDQPVVVAHALTGAAHGIDNSSTSELASCNYIARSYGIKNGMFLGQAQALCPQLVVLPYEYDKYDAVSKLLYHTLLLHSNYVQAVSCDEAYIDVTFNIHEILQEQGMDVASIGKKESFSSTYCTSNTTTNKRNRSFPAFDHEDEDEDEDEDYGDANMLKGNRRPASTHTGGKPMQGNNVVLKKVDQLAADIAQRIRKEILTQTGCVASIGIGPNMLQARIATQKAKPDGVYSLLQPAVELSTLLSGLAIRDLPGVGHVTAKKCEEAWGLKTCGDIINQPAHLATKVVSSEAMSLLLQKELGAKTGLTLFQFAQGKDDRTLANTARQSIGSEINWGIRFITQEEADRFLLEFCQEVHSRLLSVQQSYGHASTFTVSHVIVCAKKKLHEGEPGKFLGCGHCQDYSKSVAVSKKFAQSLLLPSESMSAGANDCDLKGHLLLYKLVSELYRDLAVEVKDARGVGIHLKRDMSNVQQSEAGNSASSGSNKLTAFFQQGKTDHMADTHITEKEETGDDLFDLIDAEDRDIWHSSFLLSENNEAGTESATEESAKKTTRNLEPERSIKDISAATSPSKRDSNENGVLTSPSKRVKMMQQQKQEHLIRAFLSRPSSMCTKIASKATSIRSFLSDEDDPRDDISHQKSSVELKESPVSELKCSNATTVLKESHDRAEVVELFTASPVTPSKSVAAIKSSSTSMDEIDESVLNELPDDIRNEILQEHRRTASSLSVISPVTVSGAKRSLSADSQHTSSASNKKLITSFFQSNPTANSPHRSPEKAFTVNSRSTSSTTTTSKYNLDTDIKNLKKLFAERKSSKDKDFENFVDVHMLKELPVEIAKEQVQQLATQLKLTKK